MKLLREYRTSVTGPKNTTGTQAVAIKEKPRVRPKVLSYKGGKYGLAHRAGWRENVYDLGEINRAADVESALLNSFKRHRELFMKGSYFLWSKNPRVLKAVKNRIRLIELFSRRSFKSLLREVAFNLIKFHTAFIYKRRDASRSTGRETRLFGKKLEPIAALEVVDPCSMQVRQNKSGGINGWRQYIPETGEESIFEWDEIICITMDRKSGFVFGTPYAIPVLDDILALRRLEELVEIITAKHAFPLYQYKVGSKEHPCSDIIQDNGTKISEIDIVRAELGDMPTEGGIVTSERHEIVVIGAKDAAIDVKPYLDYFKARVDSGLRLSGIEQGQGDTANRGTATTMFKNIAEAVQDYQDVIADDVTFHLLNEIVLEEGIDLTEDNEVVLRFPSVDREEERAHQNHWMTLYQGHMVTEDEARKELGLEPLSAGDRKKTYMQLIEVPMAKLSKAENKATQGAKGTASSKAKPKNQSGSKVKPRTPKNDSELRIMGIWHGARESVRRGEDMEQVLGSLDQVMLSGLRSILIREMDKVTDIIVPSDLRMDFFKKLARKELRNVTKRASLMSANLGKEVPMVSIFDGLEPLVLKTGTDLARLARGFALLETAKIKGCTRTSVGGTVFEVDKTTARDIARSLKNEE